MTAFGDATFGAGTFGAALIPALPHAGFPHFKWTDRCRPFLELGVGDSRVPGTAARWDVQEWDDTDAVWAGTEPWWQDVTCETYEVRIVLGRERTTDRFDVGTMSVTAANLSGWADLDQPSFADVNTLMLRPGRSIRFGVDHQTLGHVVLFRGFVDVVDPLYEPDSSIVRLQCIDAAGEVGRVKMGGDVPLVGADETVANRIGRILDAAHWPSTKRDIDGTSTPLLAVAMDGQVLDLLGQAADSAGGAVFADAQANICYRAQDWQTYPADRPPDAVIGNVAPGDVCPTRWSRPYARADMATRIIVANQAEPALAAVIDDQDAWSLYGIETFERSDLSTRDQDDLNRLANRYYFTRGPSTIPRIRSVGLDGRTGNDVVDLLTAASPYEPTRYRCRLLLPRGPVFDQDHYCTGLGYVITPEGWTADLNLDLSAPFAATSAPRWEPASGDDAGLGRWSRSQWN
jgi:hypothetical protein